MWSVLRFLGALVLSLGLVTGLFAGMRSLVAAEGLGQERETSLRVVGFVRRKTTEQPPPPDRTLPERPRTPTPPAIPAAASAAVDSQSSPVQLQPRQQGPITQELPDVGLELRGGLQLGTSVHDTDATPLLRVQPEYPPRAADQNLEGWVLIRFGIGKLGEVIDPVIVDAQPAHIFDEAALRAVRRWKYQPKVRDGHPVTRHGLLVRLSFELD